MSKNKSVQPKQEIEPVNNITKPSTTLSGKETTTIIYDEGLSSNSKTTPVETYKEKIGVVTTAILNIRSQPKKTVSNIIGKITKDTEVLIEGESGDFYKIITKPGDSGYCMKEFIRIRGEDVG